MGNFLGNLGKGFIRSAVNQVGRDGGKVISNSLYGNAHATPIRGVFQSTNNQYFDEESNEIISPEELRQRAEMEGFKTCLFRYNPLIKILAYIGSLLISFLYFPSIILFIYGVKKLFQKTAFMKKKDTIAQYVSDHRYKDGRRLNGYVEKDIIIKVPCSHSERNILIRAGILYILLSFTSLYLGVYIYQMAELDGHKKFIEQSEEKKEYIKERFELLKDTTSYNKEMEEFNKKYQEAIEYINSHK